MGLTHNSFTRITFMFTLRNQGWSETYYPRETGSTVPATVYQDWITARMALSPPDVTLVRGRITNYPGDFQTVIVPGLPTGGSSAESAHSDTLWTSLLLRMRTQTGHHVNHWIRGVPSAEILNGVYAPSLNYRSAIDTFWMELVTEWLGRVHAHAAAPGVFFLDPYVSLDEVLLSNRKIGRPFGQFRGRRRVR
jgi:hypothetical protein